MKFYRMRQETHKSKQKWKLYKITGNVTFNYF